MRHHRARIHRRLHRLTRRQRRPIRRRPLRTTLPRRRSRKLHTPNNRRSRCSAAVADCRIGTIARPCVMRDRMKVRDATGRSYVTLESPVGTLTLVATPKGLSELWFDKPAATELRRAIGRPSPRNPVLAESGRQLREYFAGKRSMFAIPLDLSGTAFQRSAWLGLLDIPFGETRTYAEHASRIGHPRAVRAVGAANGRNPIAIIVPCHRLVGSDGSLTGFGGGLRAKAWLLALEQTTAAGEISTSSAATRRRTVDSDR